MKETHYATITSKGQITIPKAIRETLSVYSGDRVAFTVEDGDVAVAGVSSDISDLAGSVKSSTGNDPGDFDDIAEEAWRDAAAARVRRLGES